MILTSPMPKKSSFISFKNTVDTWKFLSESLTQDSFKTCALTTRVGESEHELVNCLKSGQTFRSQRDLLQKPLYEGEAADLAITPEDFATRASSESFQDDEGSSSE